MRSFRWALIQYDCNPYKKRKEGQRHTQTADHTETGRRRVSASQAGASLVAKLVTNPPAMRETWVRSLGWEDPLEKGKATHPSILAWRIPGTVQSMGLQRGRHDWVAFTHKPRRDLRRKQPCRHLDLGLAGSNTSEEIHFCYFIQGSSTPRPQT